MKKFYALIFSIVVASCLSEDGVAPGDAPTFIRYFNGGNNDEAKALEFAPDGGFMLLATTRIQKAEADIPHTKIKVVKTDANGNPLWQRLYPGFSKVTKRDYTASSIISYPSGGYVIVGDVIDTTKTGIGQSFVMKIDENGVPQDSVDFSISASIAEKGKAVAINSAGNIIVLSTQGSTVMIVSEIDANTFSVLSQVDHAQGETTLSNKLYVAPSDKVVMSGSKTVVGLTGIRLLRTIPQSFSVDWDQFLNEPGYSLAGYDFCKYGTGYAIAGATNQKPDGTAATDTDVMFFLTDSEGNRIRLTTFPFDDPNTPQNEDNQIDAGNAIASTSDGGLIFFSSINSAAIEGRGDTEFYLIKIDAFGDKEWTSSFGSRYKDEAVAIRQTSDGYFVALGTTTQGALKILTLFKADKQGKIQ